MKTGGWEYGFGQALYAVAGIIVGVQAGAWWGLALMAFGLGVGIQINAAVHRLGGFDG